MSESERQHERELEQQQDEANYYAAKDADDLAKAHEEIVALKAKLAEAEKGRSDSRGALGETMRWLVRLASEVGWKFGEPLEDVYKKGAEMKARLEMLTGTMFQERVKPWMMATFGVAEDAPKLERSYRFIEEALELAQSCGCTKEAAIEVLEYVYSRPIGEPKQEVGGTMITLAALCLAFGIDMHEAGEEELKRVWTKVEKIRAKSAAKPKFGSPLPGPQSTK